MGFVKYSQVREWGDVNIDMDSPFLFNDSRYAQNTKNSRIHVRRTFSNVPLSEMH